MRMRVEKREFAREFNLLSSPGQTRARVARELLEDERDHELSSSCTWALGTLAYDENSSVVKLLQMKGMGIDFRHADSFQTSQQ
jgi:hypothetical protein